MKLIKFLIILAAFLVMLAAVVNIYFLAQAGGSSLSGVYLELVSLIVLSVCLVLLVNIERKNKLTKK